MKKSMQKSDSKKSLVPKANVSRVSSSLSKISPSKSNTKITNKKKTIFAMESKPERLGSIFGREQPPISISKSKNSVSSKTVLTNSPDGRSSKSPASRNRSLHKPLPKKIPYVNISPITPE